MRLSLLVSDQIWFRLEPFCAFGTVELSEARKIFSSLCALVLLQVLFLVDVVVDLIQIACVTASLLLRVLTTNGRHRGFLMGRWNCRSSVDVILGLQVAVTIAVRRGHAKLLGTRLLRKLMQPGWNFYFGFAKHSLSGCGQIQDGSGS